MLAVWLKAMDATKYLFVSSTRAASFEISSSFSRRRSCVIDDEDLDDDEDVVGEGVADERNVVPVYNAGQ
jgi:hypothetical protein